MTEKGINKAIIKFKSINFLVVALLFSLLFINPLSTKAKESEGKETKFQPSKLIMGHIKDAYEWHIIDINEKHISIPLPIIAYHKTEGLTIFLSSKFNHGHDSYKGYRLEYREKEFRNVLVREDGESFYNLSLTTATSTILMVTVLLILVFTSVAKSYKKREGHAPKGFQSLIEPIILFIRDEVVKPAIGKGYERFMPLLLTMFFFIWFTNLFGIIPFFPGGANVTGNIAVTLVLASFTLIATLLVGNKFYWKHIFLPDVPVWMYPILVPIEIIGVILKPFVLMLRLFANILAEHIISLGFFSLIFIFGETSQIAGMGFGVFSVLFTVFMGLLSILLTFIQAYVFTLLSALYLGMATEEHH